MPNPNDHVQAEGTAPHGTCPVVGIGSSAGGLEALEQFFADTPPEPGAAFVVVSHLAPHDRSLLPELLARKTAMRVVAATDAVTVEPNARERPDLPATSNSSSATRLPAKQ